MYFWILKRTSGKGEGTALGFVSTVPGTAAHAAGIRDLPNQTSIQAAAPATTTPKAIPSFQICFDTSLLPGLVFRPRPVYNVRWLGRQVGVVIEGYPVRVLPTSGAMQAVAYEAVNVEVLARLPGRGSGK